jgi:hypothetical protein
MTLFGRGSAARLAIVLGAPPRFIEVPDDGDAPGGDAPDGDAPGGEAPAAAVPDDEASAGEAHGAPVHDGEPTGAPDDGSGPPAPDGGSGPPAPAPLHDQRAPIGVSEPDGALQVPADHASRVSEGRWDEGVDEIPDDEFPVRDEDVGPDDAGPPVAPSPGAGTGDRVDEAEGPPHIEPDDPEPATPGVVAPDPVMEWRAHALCCAFRGRGVPADVERLPDGRPVVRSAYRADLVGLASAWRAEDGSTAVPTDLELDGPRLRLWVLAAGRRRGRAYTLGLDPHSRATHEPLLTACQRAGLGATLAGDEDDPVVEIVGLRRQRRLAELVGDRPRSLVEGVWPE